MRTLGDIQSMAHVVLTKLERMSICWRGIPLSDRDKHTYTEAIVLWLVNLIDVTSLYGSRPTREYINWAITIAKVDVAELAECLTDVSTYLRTCYADGERHTWFERQVRQDYPFFGILVSPVKTHFSQFLRRPNAVDFTILYQYFAFLTHLTLVDIDIDMEPEYVAMEQNLTCNIYDSELVSSLNAIMREWFADFAWDPERFIPYHGPGACAELPRREGNLAKYTVLGTDMRLDYFLTRCVDAPAVTFYPYTPRAFTRTSVLVSVPKSIKTRRTISKEPATLMYFQQAAKDQIMHYVHNHPYLSQHIDLMRQEKNGRLALLGSRTHDFATVDLSAASDSVTLSLVKSVFRGTPILSALLSLRSSNVMLPSGKEIVVEKYAPMGSALCFPVETLIFSCITEYATRCTQAKWGRYCPTWRVYGDDIIVEDPCYWDLVMNLKRCNFSVNTRKSYSAPYRFRESCGYEGFDGVDVTPMRISRRFSGTTPYGAAFTPSQFNGLVDMANSCHIYEFPLTRAWIVSNLLHNLRVTPLFSREGKGNLYSPCPDNYRAKRRPWTYGEELNLHRPWYQTETILVSLVRSVRDADPKPELEQARLWETLRLTHTREKDPCDPDYLVRVPDGTSVDKLVTRWVSDPA